MKEQNQISEVAKKATERIELVLQDDMRKGLVIMGTNHTNKISVIIQSAIDAATAEVKKEESLGSETHATLDLQRAETGDPFLRIAKVLDAVFDRDKGALRLFDVERGKVYAAHLGKTLSGQRSEVPTQKAPTDTGGRTEHGKGGANVYTPVTPAAPSRKQEAKEIALEAANRIYNGLQINPDFGTKDAAEIIERCLDAAARVEPTKKWEVHKTNQPEPYNWDIYCGDGHSVIKGFLTEQQAKSLTAAHNASCAVEPTKEWSVKESASGKIVILDFVAGTCGFGVEQKHVIESIVIAHNASCAVKEEKEKSL